MPCSPGTTDVDDHSKDIRGESRRTCLIAILSEQHFFRGLFLAEQSADL